MHLKFDRFISADDIAAMLDSPMSLWDKNLYVYCDNDPVNKKDDDGEIAKFCSNGYYWRSGQCRYFFYYSKDARAGLWMAECIGRLNKRGVVCNSGKYQ